jgi:hypothetical protein
MVGSPTISRARRKQTTLTETRRHPAAPAGSRTRLAHSRLDAVEDADQDGDRADPGHQRPVLARRVVGEGAPQAPGALGACPLNPPPGSKWDARPKPAERKVLRLVNAGGVASTVRDGVARRSPQPAGSSRPKADTAHRQLVEPASFRRTAHERVGDGDVLLVAENSDTVDSLVRTLIERPGHIGLVGWALAAASKRRCSPAARRPGNSQLRRPRSAACGQLGPKRAGMTSVTRSGASP